MHVPRTADDGTTYVEVVREPEWSDEDRLQAEALILCEQLTCRSCGCWLPESSHEDFAGYVEQDVCHGCKALDIVRRKTAAEHKNEPDPAPGRPAWDDGLRLTVRAAAPAELEGQFRPE